MGTGEPEVPEEACVEPPLPPSSIPVPSFIETYDNEVFNIVSGPEEEWIALCPKTVAHFELEVDELPRPLEVQITRPGSPMEFPPGNFPLVVFSHGNGQNGQNYNELFKDFAQKGFIVASIINDGDVDSPGESRAHNLLCMAEALLDSNVTWTGTGRLDGRYVLAGHSTGGYGAVFAADSVMNNPDILVEHDFSSIAAIAPNRISTTSSLSLSPNTPPFFVIQGTGDGDTIGAAFSIYDRVLADILAGGVIDLAPRKVLVWAYDVEHNRYGGTDFCSSEKGTALVTTYLTGFLLAALYQDPASLDLFFPSEAASPEIPSTVDDPSFWVPFEGVPQVYGTSQREVSPNTGFEALIIDGFEDDDINLSDAGLEVIPSHPALYHIETVNWHRTNAAVVEWQDGDTLTWKLDFDTRVALAGATSLSFRGGAVAEIENEDECLGSVGNLPMLSITFTIDGVPYGPIDLSPYGRSALPDTRPDSSCVNGITKPCDNPDVMQTTFRLPLKEFCNISSEISLSEVDEITINFNGASNNDIFFLDDLIIHRVPGEPGVMCRCPG